MLPRYRRAPTFKDHELPVAGSERYALITPLLPQSLAKGVGVSNLRGEAQLDHRGLLLIGGDPPMDDGAAQDLGELGGDENADVAAIPGASAEKFCRYAFARSSVYGTPDTDRACSMR
ncbi:hypothetical protein [Specibacter sp. NPDC078692]|uniref:hypothetical protein n=1 Tax=Specibacter sp. NPDC078692 TaxID=3155818 RepID=UPI0034266414